MLKFADDRIATLQAGKTCVKAAKNDDDLTACKEKFMAEMKRKRAEMKQKREMKDYPEGEKGGSQGK
jgi:TATA-box binding protein (TBP) (component of TFIID and TFIIIB)